MKSYQDPLEKNLLFYMTLAERHMHPISCRSPYLELMWTTFVNQKGIKCKKFIKQHHNCLCSKYHSPIKTLKWLWNICGIPISDICQYEMFDASTLFIDEGYSLEPKKHSWVVMKINWTVRTNSFLNILLQKQNWFST